MRRRWRDRSTKNLVKSPVNSTAQAVAIEFRLEAVAICPVEVRSNEGLNAPEAYSDEGRSAKKEGKRGRGAAAT